MLKFKQFPWQTDFTFDEIETIEGSPRLYKTPYGNFPSTTSFLSILKDPNDTGLEDWRNRIGHDEADRITQEAADRGNALHDYNELYLQNRLNRLDLKGQARVLFNRVKQYLDEIELLVATEVALYHTDLKYAGRVDCIGMLYDHLTIIDHKNSRRPISISNRFGRTKLYKYMLQCCAYSMALENMKGLKADRGCLIVGNHLTSTSDRFIFELQPLRQEIELIIDAYYNDRELIKKSVYFDDGGLTRLLSDVIMEL